MSTELVLVPRDERTQRRINYALWIFNWRFQQAVPGLTAAFQSLARGVRQAFALFDHIGYDPHTNRRYVGGHWYPVEHMPMTARQYRAWKRREGRR